MRTFFQKFLTPFLIPILILSNFQSLNGCADSSIAPVFQYKYAPENPFENFAAGKIGILKPTYRRVVLIAAYRYLHGGGFSDPEQKALVSVWNAEFKNEEPDENEKTGVIKNWLEKRKEVFKEENQPPAIYAERKYRSESYSFFPNCSANAFEVAAETLSDRILNYGAEDKMVAQWLNAQDTVFENCAGGAKIPAAPDAAFPEWLKKDREYQIAAAYFYSTDFEEAKKRFEAIAADTDSVWRETAAYLVGRTLVRLASFSKDAAQREELYREAENHLNNLPGGKFRDAAQKLQNLIRLRQKPAVRVRELAQDLEFQQNGVQMRQDLIDYTWLLDKFETQALKTDEKRKDDEERARFAESDRALQAEISSKLSAIGVSIEVLVLKGEVTLRGKIPSEKWEQVSTVVSDAKPRRINRDNVVLVTNNPDGSVTYQGGGGSEFSPFSSERAKTEWEKIMSGELIEINYYGGGSFRLVIPPETPDDEISERIKTGLTNFSDEEGEKIKAAIKEARARQIKNKFSTDFDAALAFDKAAVSHSSDLSSRHFSSACR
jgi:hypothetical protein